MTEPEDEFEITEHDSEYQNVYLRAGYLIGLAYQSDDPQDRLFLCRASRSLRAYAKMLHEQQKAKATEVAGSDPCGEDQND